MPALLGFVPAAWGPKVGAQAGAVTCTRTGPNEIHFVAPAHLTLVLLTPQPNREVALNSDRKTIISAPVGCIEVIPKNAELFARWTVDKENLLFALDQHRLSQLAGMEFQNDAFVFHPPRPGHVDNRALYLARLARQEMRWEGAKNLLYIDALITVFGTHLLRTYSSFSGAPRRPASGGLPPRTWRNIIDYIQANLNADLSIGSLAALAELSPSHFMRAFRQSTGQAPHQYIISQQLTLGAHLIKTTQLPFGVIASVVGFSSNSHMTATMKRVWNTTPAVLRRDEGMTSGEQDRLDEVLHAGDARGSAT